MLQENYQSVKRFGLRIRINILSVFIWVETVCSGYQQISEGRR